MARIIGCALGLSLTLSSCVNWSEAQTSFCEANPACKENAKLVWQKRLGGTGLESVNAMALSQTGEAVLGGFYTGNSELGGPGLSVSGQQDLFVARFKPDGTTRWSIGAGGSGNDQVMGVAVDSFDHTLVGGDFSSATVDFHLSGAMTRKGATDGFAIAFNPAGELMWFNVLGGTDALTSVRDVAVVPSSGAGFVTGTFRGTVDFGGAPRTTTVDGMFLAQLSALGPIDQLLLDGSCDPGGAIRGEAVAIDSQKNIYLAAQYQGTCEVGGTALAVAPVQSPGLVVVKLGPSGTELWRATHPDLNLTGRVRIATDRKDNLLVTAGFKNTLSLPAGGVLESQNHATSDVLLIKLARSTGAVDWARAAGGPANDLGRALAIKDDNTVWLAGSAEGAAVSFGTLSVEPKGQTDAFLAHYSEAGEPLLAEAYGDSAAQSARALGVDGEDLIIGGDFAGSFTLEDGAEPLSAKGTDLFLARRRQ